MDVTFRPRPRLLRRSKISAYAQSWALVSGAAREQGLGYAFARQLAVEGLNLVLVDILDEELHARANELRQQFGVEVRTAICDLGAPAPYKALEEAVGGLDIDVLVCNHMFTPADTPPILDMPLDTHSRMIDINARAYTNLIHRFGREDPFDDDLPGQRMRLRPVDGSGLRRDRRGPPDGGLAGGLRGMTASRHVVFILASRDCILIAASSLSLPFNLRG